MVSETGEGARLKAKLVIQAGVRLCSARGVPAMVTRRGDPDAGAVYVKVNRFELGCSVLNKVYMEGGRLAWVTAIGETPVSEREADDYIARQVRSDPDLWVLEVEDRAGRNPFDDFSPAA